SSETPITTSPCSPYCFCSAMKPGISTLHGAHQVAQKSRITTLPRKSEDFTSFPSKSFSFKAGAGLEAIELSEIERNNGRRLLIPQARNAKANRAAKPRL